MEKVREVTFKAAREAGGLLRERLGHIKSVDYKSAFNIVTDVDKASERMIIGILSEAFPDYNILAEEGGATDSGGRRRWLIDPLDGTTNYTHAYPFFAVSIGLEEDGKMIWGVVYNPVSEELFWAEAGKGAWLNNQPIKVSCTGTLSGSLLSTGFPPDTQELRDDNMLRFHTLTDLSHGVRRDGSAALDLCFVACGRFDGFWEKKLSPWDTAAGSIVVTEAGGRVSNLSGGPFDMASGHILATNGLIHEEVLSIMARVDKELASAR